ncbi:MAG: hypothetical protein ACJ72N_12770 [Labedaea sp.]
MTDDFTELPGRVAAELTRLRAERQVFTAEQDRLKARLVATEQEVQQLTDLTGDLAAKDERIAELAGLVGQLERGQAETVARAEALSEDLATVRLERDALRAELVSCRQERDRLRLHLLDAELALAAGPVEDDRGPAEADLHRAALAEQKLGELVRELDATHQTLSWRVTRPLRAVRRKIPRP